MNGLCAQRIAKIAQDFAVKWVLWPSIGENCLLAKKTADLAE